MELAFVLLGFASVMFVTANFIFHFLICDKPRGTVKLGLVFAAGILEILSSILLFFVFLIKKPSPFWCAYLISGMIMLRGLILVYKGESARRRRKNSKIPS